MVNSTMHKIARRILKPLFSAIAYPGMGLPHIYNEQKLMVAGVKPTGIFLLPFVLEDGMPEALQDGRIIALPGELDMVETIYGHPDVLGNLNKLYDRDRQSAWTEPTPQEVLEAAKSHKAVYEEQQNICVDQIIDTPNMQPFCQGKIPDLCVRYVHGYDPAERAEPFEDGVLKGHLSVIRNHHPVSWYFALASKREDGIKLRDCYSGRVRDPNVNCGLLLGYTPQDVAFFEHRGIYSNPWIKTVLDKTMNARRWFRYHSMMMDAEDLREAPAHEPA